jgi:hypothetical protein
VRLEAAGRAARLAAAIADPARRQVAAGLLQRVAGRRAQAERILFAVLEAPSASSEAVPALLLLHRGEIARGRTPAWSAAHLANDPAAQAVVEAWRVTERRGPAAARELETRLAALDPRHPLALAATALRLGWRLALGDPTLAREALGLLDLELVRGSDGPRGLIHRARLGVRAQDRSVALGSLAELTARLALERRPAVARAALSTLETFPADWEDDRYRRLHAALAESAVLPASSPETTDPGELLSVPSAVPATRRRAHLAGSSCGSPDKCG